MNALAFVAPLALLVACADTPDQLVEKFKDPSPRVRRLAAEEAGKQKLQAAVPALGELLLKDKEWAVRSAAANALGQIGPKAVPTLVALAGDENVWVKVLALGALRQVGPDARDAVEVLTAALTHMDPNVRILAALALGNIGPGAKAALPNLFRAAKDTSRGTFLVFENPKGVAETAVEAAQKVDPACGAKLAEAVLPDLTAALKDKNDEAVWSAVSALQQLGQHARQAVPALKEAHKTAATGYSTESMVPQAIAVITGDPIKPRLDIIRDANLPPEKRLNAVKSLMWAEPSDQVIAALCELLADPESKIRAAAVEALGQRRATKAALPHLLKLLEWDNPDRYVRYGPPGPLLLALAGIGPDAVPSLVGVLKGKDQSVSARYQAVQGLGLMGPRAKDAKPALEGALGDQSAAVAIESAVALVQVGGDIAKALPVLRAGLEHTEPAVILLAAGAIERLGEPAKGAVPNLKALLDHSSRDRRIAAAQALGAIGPPAKGAAKAIGELVKAENDWESGRAAEALARLGPAAGDAVPALAEALKHPRVKTYSTHPVHRALQAIGADAKGAVPVLLEQLKMADDFYAGCVMETLGRIGPGASEAVPLVAAHLTNKEPSMRSLAARTLGAIGPDAKETLPALEKLLNDEWRPTRVWAAYALARITGDTKTYVAEMIDLWKSDRIPIGYYSAQSYVVEALGLLGPDGAAGCELLLTAVTNENTAPGIRSKAADALGKMPAEAGVIVPRLITLLEAHKKGQWGSYRYSDAARVLGALGPAARDAVPLLRRLAEDDVSDVAVAAAAAIKRITGKD